MLQLDYMQILLGGFILFIIAGSLCTSIRIVPYSRDNMFAIEYPYEGFKGFHPENCPCGCRREPFTECVNKKNRVVVVQQKNTVIVVIKRKTRIV